jgi:hypothetical protein
LQERKTSQNNTEKKENKKDSLNKREGGMEKKRRMDRFCSKGTFPNSPALLVDHEKNTEIHPCPEGPVKWTIWNKGKKKDMSYRGVTRTLKDLFFPDTRAAVQKKRRFGTSSKKTGSVVHRHLYHHFSCKQKGLCYCKTKSRKKLTQYATLAIKKLAQMKITVEGAEVPVVSHSTRIATRLDLVGTRWRNEPGERSVIISIKTGYAFPGDKGECEENFLRSPFHEIPNTFANQNQLQGICEKALLRTDYGIEFDDYFLFYLGKQNGKAECKVERLLPWAKREMENEMIKKLKTRFKKKK